MANVRSGKPAVEGWERTALALRLGELAQTDAEGGVVMSCLHQVLDPVQTLLASSGTSPKDFTLHDAGHAFRVAELMLTIIPEDVAGRLTLCELALLLMAAYCHDIGMVPEQSKEEEILQYLKGEESNLSEQEVIELRTWLDDAPETFRHEMYWDDRFEEHFFEAEYATALYIRFRHNDWTEEWMRANLGKVSFGSYINWLDDLVHLCKSHHEGYARLLAKDFDPSLRGSPGQLVNLRYLAAVLRLADVLEIDPERTPEIVFRQRLVHERSQIYWFKDRSISPAISPNRIILHAQPTSARVHQAIKETVEQINVELRLCARLQEEGRFQTGPGLGLLQYRLDLPIAVSDEIRPSANSYEFIDGSFRPDTNKLLELLGGHHIYGQESLIAVRELLQNAFDAIKEAVGHQRLQQPDPSDSKWEEVLGQLHSVKLTVQEREEDGESRLWLLCEDTGVGMTKQIIESYLLVPGRSRRHTVLDLERRCLAAGFFLERTGQFGIGVLSYFMLADRIIIETRRGDQYGDADGPGWRFETDGVGTFGELRKHRRERSGTTVALRLRGRYGGHKRRRRKGGDFEGDRFLSAHAQNGLGERLHDYLRKLLIRVPSHVELFAGSDSLFAIRPGWGDAESEAVSVIEAECKKKGINLVLGDPIEGSLSEGKLRFRFLPYAYLDEDFETFGFSAYGPNEELNCTAYVIEAWRGSNMHSSSKDMNTHVSVPGIVLLDWIGEDQHSVSVSRNNFEVRQRDAVIEAVGEKVSPLITQWRVTLARIPLSERLTYGFLPDPEEAMWPLWTGRIERLSGLVSFVNGYERRELRRLRFNNEAIQLSPLLHSGLHHSDMEKKVAFVHSRGRQLKPRLLFDFRQWSPGFVTLQYPQATFPPTWGSVFGGYVDTPPFQTFLNTNNKLVSRLFQGSAALNSDDRGLLQFLLGLLKNSEERQLTAPEQSRIAPLIEFLPLIWFDNESFVALYSDRTAMFSHAKAEDLGLVPVPEEWLMKRPGRKMLTTRKSVGTVK